MLKNYLQKNLFENDHKQLKQILIQELKHYTDKKLTMF